ncbi:MULTISPECIES: hypothetical protein [Thermococcus]|uniref:Thiol protease n=1 Tax=Thermococcus nautili TaxID=195522 RepID=W8NTA9_9EURY|nr:MULTISPECIES: hypothetical protein [Thermococcus]AHL22493.1 thiol protease [Thermococcus nautili]NJE48259.1 hypothetical protein [Thermococcus sp. 9N3]
MRKVALAILGVLLLGMAVPQAGAVSLTTTSGVSPTTIMMLTYFYYRNYNALLPEFNATYQKAVELGVDNTTLSRAMELYTNATTFMEKATEVSAGGNILASLGSYRVMILVRNAYFTLRDAYEVLTTAIQNATVANVTRS